MNKHYESLHNHSYYSNIGAHVECIDSPEAWAKQLKSMGFKAMSLSDHGSVLGWYNKYMAAKKHGLKYIHSTEAYVTESDTEKIRDNMHVILIAKNYEGLLELNRIMSKSSQRDTNNFFYNPRISLDDLFETSDNIIVTSACLGGILAKPAMNEEMRSGLLQKITKWFITNKHRCYLEVQMHNDPEQIRWNNILKKLSQQTGLKLVGAGDFHAINPEHDESRKIMKASKRIAFDGEDNFILHLQSYEEMLNKFMAQNIWTEYEVETLLNQTNLIVDDVEEFEIDTSIKYPKLYNNGQDVLWDKIENAWNDNKKIQGFSNEMKQAYMERIRYEFDVVKKLGAPDYFLLEDWLKTWARSEGIEYGPARGSASGSLICYLLKITQIDPIEHKLSFERFLNPDRVGVADIDSDFSDQKAVQRHLLENEKLNCAHIVAFGTVKLKGAIKDCARGLNMSLDIADEISKNIEDGEEMYREKYPELFKHVDRVIGTITSISTHPCAMLVTDHDLKSEVGTFTLVDKNTKEPVLCTTIDMIEVESLNFVKLDILSLDAIKIIKDCCNAAGIDYQSVMPDSIDAADVDVWNSIKEDGVNVFQFESMFSHSIYKDLFREGVIEKIREIDPNVSYVNLLSLANAILRPSGESIRQDVANGVFNKNGHAGIDEYLKETRGYLAYQENLAGFLVEFCGFGRGESFLTLKGIAKKRPEILERDLPRIRENLYARLIKDGVDKSQAEKYVEEVYTIFVNSKDYSFSRNHSIPYSFISYACAYLRWHYPLEFITAAMNANSDDMEQLARLTSYAKTRGIEINPIKFRYSKSRYMMDKSTNSIYQGIESIKFLNESVSDGLYNLRDRKYKCFVDLLIDIRHGNVLELLQKKTIDEMKVLDKQIKTGEFELPLNPVKINSRQMDILIGLDFFSEFGNPNELREIYARFQKLYTKPTLTLATQHKRYHDLIREESKTKCSKITPPSLVDTCVFELEFLGSCVTANPQAPENGYLITNLVENKTYARIEAYHFKTGEVVLIKMGNRTYSDINPSILDVLRVTDSKYKPKHKKVNGKWTEMEDEFDFWVTEAQVIKRQER